MDPLELSYDNKDLIPEGFEALYTEKSGKWELSQIKGLQTAENVTRLQKSLHAAQADNKKLKEAAKAWEGFGDVEALQAKLDQFEELEALAAGKGDDSKLEELAAKRVEAVLKSKTSPLERQLKQMADQVAALTAENQGYVGEKRQRSIHDAIRGAATAKDVGLLQEAIDDALVLGERLFEVTEDGKVVTRDGVGVTPGIDAKGWLIDVREKKPHWWPASQGGGANGTRPGAGPGGKNPWSADHWNLTEQGQVIRTQGEEKAKRMAEAAGSHLGAVRPKKAPAR